MKNILDRLESVVASTDATLSRKLTEETVSDVVSGLFRDQGNVNTPLLKRFKKALSDRKFDSFDSEGETVKDGSKENEYTARWTQDDFTLIFHVYEKKGRLKVGGDQNYDMARLNTDEDDIEIPLGVALSMMGY